MKFFAQNFTATAITQHLQYSFTQHCHQNYTTTDRKMLTSSEVAVHVQLVTSLCWLV